jgi:molybdenum cofactor synthesis domain-containing protein
MVRIAALVVGNEILLGRTKDTNTLYLVETLIDKGLKLSRWTIVPDRKEDIASQLRSLINDGFDLIVVTGGMGPTHDDITVVSVSESLEFELSFHDETNNRMIDKWKKRFPGKDLPGSSTKGVRKMSMLPKGFSPLRNDAGMAEGLTGLSREGSRIVIVPGVPVEYRSVIGGMEFKKLLPPSEPEDQWIEEVLFKGKESQVSDLLEELQKKYETLDIGSYPQGVMRVLIRLTGRKEKVEDALHCIREDLAMMEKRNEKEEK